VDGVAGGGDGEDQAEPLQRTASPGCIELTELLEPDGGELEADCPDP
jgi:hypothetical protein